MITAGKYFRKRSLEREVYVCLALVARTIADRGQPAWDTHNRKPPEATWAEPIPYARGFCPVCRRETFRDGDWRAEAGKRHHAAQWHAPCLAAYKLWTKPNDYAMALARRQNGACPITGESLITSVAPRDWEEEASFFTHSGIEVDHRIPLWWVKRNAVHFTWLQSFAFWGLDNLQALSARGHKIKTAREAKLRGRPK